MSLVDKWKTNLMSLAILFHLLWAQHVSDINISIFRRLQLCWWITTSVVLFSVRCVLEFLLRLVFGGVRFAGFSLKMDILMSETCWAHNKWNKIASDIKLVFHSSEIISLWVSWRIVLPPALINSAGIWTVTGDWCLFSFKQISQTQCTQLSH